MEHNIHAAHLAFAIDIPHAKHPLVITSLPGFLEQGPPLSVDVPVEEVPLEVLPVLELRLALAVEDAVLPLTAVFEAILACADAATMWFLIEIHLACVFAAPSLFNNLRLAKEIVSHVLGSGVNATLNGFELK